MTDPGSAIIEDEDLAGFGERIVTLSAEDAGGRIDKVLAAHLPELSRARVQALIAEGRVTQDGRPLTDPSAKAQAAAYRLEIPAPRPAEPSPEAIPLTV